MNQKKSVRMYDQYINAICNRGCFDMRDKEAIYDTHIAYMLNRTQSMFKWEGLPDSIPARVLELQLQTNGNVAFIEQEGSLYALTGGLGGEPNPYYMPTKYVIANPALRLDKTYTIDKDCIVIPNDALYIGLLPMFSKYASMLTENELSIYIADINSRLVNFFGASDDVTKESVDNLIDNVEKGRLSCVLDKRRLMDNGVIAEPLTTSGKTGAITDLIELEQYLRAVWFNDLGLNANYNMKRESINSGESQLNNDALLPLIDNMLTVRREGAEKVNAMFGTSITVSYASAWEDNEIEIANEQAEVSARAENDEGGEDSAQKPAPDMSE